VPTPPPSFQRDDLQRLFVEVGSQIAYQQFQFLPANAGAAIFNGPDDMLTVQQALFQVRRPIETTPERAREDVAAVLRIVQRRLAVETFVQCGVKVVIHLPAPGATPDAKTFVAERLLQQGGAAVQGLGPKFFAGGVKHRSIDENREEVLQIEPKAPVRALYCLGAFGGVRSPAN
jgi:hypothetical protein